MFAPGTEDLDMRTYQDAKTIAKSLRASLASRGIALGHGECLEIVAQQFGFAEWNVLAAKLASESGRPDGGADGISLTPPIPVLRVSSLTEARPFYEGFLGFAGGWGDDEGSTYAIIRRSGVELHLNAESQLT